MNSDDLQRVKLQHNARNEWIERRKRNQAEFGRILGDFRAIFSAATPSLQALIQELQPELKQRFNFDLADLRPRFRRSPQYRGPLRHSAGRSLQWSELDADPDMPNLRDCKMQIYSLWLSKLRSLVGFVERHTLTSCFEELDRTGEALLCQLIIGAAPESELLAHLLELNFQAPAWNAIARHIEVRIGDQACSLCRTYRQAEGLQDLCEDCRELVRSWAGFCLLWDFDAAYSTGATESWSGLKEASMRRFGHQSFTHATARLLTRWLQISGQSLGTAPAVADMLKLLHAQESQCSPATATEPRVGLEPPPPSTEDGRLQKLLDDLTGNHPVIVEFLWYKPSTVDFDSLPAGAFRAGRERTDAAVKKLLTRLGKKLETVYDKHRVRLEVKWQRRRVQLIHDGAA